MGKMKDALIKLAKKVTGKDAENKDSLSNVLDFMANNYQGGGSGSGKYIHTLYCSANFDCTNDTATFTFTSNDATPLTIADVAALVEADHTLVIKTVGILTSYLTELDIKYDSDNEYVLWGDRVISGESPNIDWFYDVVSLSM